MTRRPDVVRRATPWLLTLLLLGSRLVPAPALSDPVTGAVPSSLHLSTPPLYLLLAPLFTTWDGISMLSMSRLRGFLTGLTALYLLARLLRYGVVRDYPRRPIAWARELGLAGLSLIGLLVFLGAGALWHRPMMSLSGARPDERTVDFHSHTALSHDVGSTWMRGFDREANRRWHARAGFDAVFVTDHNVVGHQTPDVSHQTPDVSHQTPDASHQTADVSHWRPATDIRRHSGATIACPGIEISAWQAHIVLLGDTLPVDRGPYTRGLPGLLQLLRTSESDYGSLTLASLPEYRRNHWSRLDTLIAAGLDGFEIVNAAPKANELSEGDRNRVIALARSHNLFVAGVSDIHGWGATSMVWNLVRVPGAGTGSALCHAILGRLRTGFAAVTVVERHRLRPDSRWPMWLTPVGVLWETWRAMGWPLTLSWLLWIWLVPGARILLRSRP